MLKAEKESLCKEFEFGMSIKRDHATRTLTITQLGQHLKDLLKRFGMKSASLCQIR